MQKIKNLNRYQKFMIGAMIVMTLFFAGIYIKTILRVGYLYKDEILVPDQENGNTVYSGKINGKQAQFIVSENQSVVFQYENNKYGPYTIKEDATAIPQNGEFAEKMQGITIFKKNQVVFHGGILETGDEYWLFDQDGTLNDFRVTYVTGDGIERDENGKAIDTMEPSATTIYELLHAPKLTHKGEVFVWFAGVCICILNTLSIIFADELFKWHLLFRIRNVEKVEPSDWEIAGRYIGWTAITIMALVLFIVGLQ